MWTSCCNASRLHTSVHSNLFCACLESRSTGIVQVPEFRAVDLDSMTAEAVLKPGTTDLLSGIWWEEGSLPAMLCVLT